MSLIDPFGRQPQAVAYAVGQQRVKTAASPELSYGLAGRLYLSASGWLLLSVPNSLLRGAFDALQEPGVELPLRDGQLNAHITVMSPADLEQLGGADKISERGHVFHYTLGPLRVVAPRSWEGVSRVWYLDVQSPALKRLRASYGLTPLPHNNSHQFHITIAVRRQGVLGFNEASKAACVLGEEPDESDCEKVAADDEFAPGLPDRQRYGDLSQLPAGRLLDFVIQRHQAERAGDHRDVRFGDERGLFSWATRKELPGPGERIALFRQPLHSYGYREFEGEIPEGYGKGKVSKQRAGKLLFTKVTPEAIHFTLADKKHPERFVLLKPKSWKDNDWLLINKTPTEMLPYDKVRYKRLPQEQVESALQAMQPGETLEAKVDGASSLIKLLKHGVELLSYRKSKETGRPILHTERFFHNQPEQEIPPELVGTVLKGELYGLRDGKPLSPQELGGILNSSVAKSIQDQQDRGISLRNMVYDIQQLGSKPVDWHQVPRTERRQMIEQVLSALAGDSFTHEGKRYQLPKLLEQLQDQEAKPQSLEELKWVLEHAEQPDQQRLETADLQEPILVADTADGRPTVVDGLHRLTKALAAGQTELPAKRVSAQQLRAAEFPFHVSPAATSAADAAQLWQDIRSGRHPLTEEGVVYWPLHGTPWKSKLFEDSDVYLTGTFPGEGKYKDVGIGGFTYALEPGGPEVGRVGTGLSDELRSAAFAAPTDYVGRVARIRSQQQLPSGAYRAPALIALHEDYPQAEKQSASPSALMETATGAALQQQLASGALYDPQQPPGANLSNFIGNVARRAQQQVREQQGNRAIQDAADPAGRWDRMLADMRGDNALPLIDRLTTQL